MVPPKNNVKTTPDVLNTLSREELLALVGQLSALVQEKDGVHIPVSVFAVRLSPAEAVVKYLKEEHELRYVDIARALNRDQRGIWCTYRRAQQKHPRALTVAPSEHAVPISALGERKFSILENVVHHLRGKGVQVKTIAELVNKSPSTIATVHSRVRKKLR
jgi:DNA-directed RNA polymerase specialized sigma24 family protein